MYKHVQSILSLLGPSWAILGHNQDWAMSFPPQRLYRRRPWPPQAWPASAPAHAGWWPWLRVCPAPSCETTQKDAEKSVSRMLGGWYLTFTSYFQWIPGSLLVHLFQGLLWTRNKTQPVVLLFARSDQTALVETQPTFSKVLRVPRASPRAQDVAVTIAVQELPAVDKLYESLKRHLFLMNWRKTPHCGTLWHDGRKDFDGRAVAKQAAILLAQRQEHVELLLAGLFPLEDKHCCCCTYLLLSRFSWLWYSIKPEHC